jgi:hypothetical protein
MYKRRPTIELINYIYFSVWVNIPKVIRIIILIAVEFILVYKVYSWADKTTIGNPEHKKDESIRTIDDLPIQYRKYYEHHRR